jgi:hypothetical protein
MDDANTPARGSLEQLRRLASLAEQTGVYLDVTGLGCYRRKDVPAWYDGLSEAQRWDVQARFWEAVARTCADSPAIFCYDLMNEPVIPEGKRKPGEWLTGELAGFSYVQHISLDQSGRSRPEIARQWARKMVAAIRKHDRRHLVTVGLLPDPEGSSGFVPDKIAPELDFLCVHVYPDRKRMAEDLKMLGAFRTGKPLVIEEIFPLRCGIDELRQFIDDSRKHVSGWLGFYWGKPPEELRKSKEIGDALLLGLLEVFQKGRPGPE